MIGLIALALAAASGPYADLSQALDRFAARSAEVETTKDYPLLALSANTACTIAYTHTVADNSGEATDQIIAYRGPNADYLKVMCVTYFNRQAAIRGSFR